MADQNQQQHPSTARMEELRLLLKQRAEARVKSTESGSSAEVQISGSDPSRKLVRMPKASLRLSKWLELRLKKNDRFPRRVLARLHHNLDLYRNLQCFAQEMAKAGSETKSAVAALFAEVTDLKAQCLKLREPDYGAMMVTLSRELASLRDRVTETNPLPTAGEA
jgi:hypothetical protein